MSILLESLNKEPSSQTNQVPDIHDSHFDDDMLGDEWLLRRVKIWQVVSLSLVVLLVISGFVFYNKISQEKLLSEKLTAENSELKSQLDKALQTSESVAIQENVEISPPVVQENTSPIKQNLSAEDVTASSKQQYIPKKREVVEAPIKTVSKNISDKPATPEIKSNNTSQGSVLTKEELSEDLREQFPNIQINSFVVADNPQDSFVILDGSFYKVNQVIAPDLILREISKEYILVEFHTQLVKLPHQ